MHLKNKPPIFVPREFQQEIEALSKAGADGLWYGTSLHGMLHGLAQDDGTGGHGR